MDATRTRGEPPSWVIWLGLAIVCGGLFGICARSGTFIADEKSVLRLPHLTWWRNLPIVVSVDFTVFTDGHFRPLSYAVLAVLRSVVDWRNVLFWHILLAALHCVNAVLVYALARRLAREWMSAALAGAMFCVHPLASVVVNNPNYLHYVLGLSACLGSAHCHLTGRERGNGWRNAVGIGLFAAGLLTTHAVVVLPLALLAYETLWCRSSLWLTVKRVGPHVAVGGAALWLWAAADPHPIYYESMPITKEIWWQSLITVVGSTDWYLRGWLLGEDVPVVLHEVVERFESLTHWRLLVWVAADLGIIAWAVRRVLRRGWDGLGILFAFCAMIPFATAWWNPVRAYVSWEYLYFPLVGFGLFWGGLLDEVLRRVRGRERWAAVVGLAILTVYLGCGLLRLNGKSRNPVEWWAEALRLDPDSQTASVQLGKAYMAQGNVDEAMRYLFSPVVRSLRESCRVMAWHYIEKGELVAALMHVKYAEQGDWGLKFQDDERLLARTFEALGAVDHAEQALGMVLAADPHATDAMERMARLWLDKGLLNAAAKLVAHALRIAPGDEGLIAVREAVTRAQNGPVPEQLPTIRPADADWLRLVRATQVTPRAKDTIIRLSENYPSDPVIQTAAVWFLAREGRREEVMRRMRRVFEHIGSFGPDWRLQGPEQAWPTRRKDPTWMQ